MRSVYYPNIQKFQNSITLTEDIYHHLVNVVRVKINEPLLLISGDGYKAKSKVKEIDKKSITLSIENIEFEEDRRKFSLLLGLPKKDTCEQIIRDVVELGLKEIIPWKSTYSQWNWSTSDRLNKIMVSALEQSNNSRFPKVLQQIDKHSDLNSLFNSYKYIFVFDLVAEGQDNRVFNSRIDLSDKILFVIGPEGGLSLDEKNYLRTIPNLRFIKLQTPILRTETAVSVVFGYLLSLVGEGVI